MTPLERRRYIESLCAKYTRQELHAMAEAFELASNVSFKIFQSMVQPLVLDELIESVKQDPITPVENANEMSHPAFRSGVLSGLSLLCGAVERDHKATALLLHEAYAEKINNG